MSLPLELIKSADWQQDILGWARENPEITGAVLGGGAGAGLGGMVAGGKGALAGLLGGAGLGAWGGNAMRPEVLTELAPAVPASSPATFRRELGAALGRGYNGARDVNAKEMAAGAAMGSLVQGLGAAVARRFGWPVANLRQQILDGTTVGAFLPSTYGAISHMVADTPDRLFGDYFRQ